MLFWKHKWIPDATYNQLFPNFFQASKWKSWTIAKIYSCQINSWKLKFNDNLPAGSNSNLQNLIVTLSNFQLDSRKDSITWLPNGLAYFSSISLFKFLNSKGVRLSYLPKKKSCTHLFGGWKPLQSEMLPLALSP